MPTIAQCPECSRTYNVIKKAIGRRVRCKSCNEPFVLAPVHKLNTSEASRSHPQMGTRNRPSRRVTRSPVFWLVACSVLAGVGVAVWAMLPPSSTPPSTSNRPELQIVSTTDTSHSSDLEKATDIEAAIARASISVDAPPAAFSVPYPRGHADQDKILRANPAGVFELVSYYADKKSTQLRFHGDGSFDQWVNTDDQLRWKFSVPKAGVYRLQYNAGADAASAGNDLVATCNGQTVTTSVPDTGGFNKPKHWDAGKFTFDSPGTYEITLKPKSIRAGTQLGKFRSVALLPQETPRYYDFLFNDWHHDAPDMFTGRGPFSVGPAVHDANLDRKGFAIITRKDIVRGLNALDDFIAHKAKLGFNVMVVTEDDYGHEVGVQAGLNIRKWLHENYIDKDILYVLMIGDGHPQKGTVPVGIAGNYRQVLEDFKADKENGQFTPTDVFYADCSGEVIDANGNGHNFDRGDYDIGNDGRTGPDRRWDVIVGRIPYFGEKEGWGKFVDIDAILRKTIAYENEKDIHWRYQFGLDGTTWDLNSAFHEWAGINYVSRGVVRGSHLRPLSYENGNTAFLANQTVGYIRTGGHANAHFIEGGISRDTIRESLIGRKQVVKEYGGCSCATPEFNSNLAYTHLRYQAIGVEGASRSIGTLGSSSRPYRRSWRWLMLVHGLSQGHAHWQWIFDDAKERGAFHGGNMMFMLYGDPSVRPFPHGLKTSYPAKIRPVHRRSVVVSGAAELRDDGFEFDIANNQDRRTKWAIASKPEWLDCDGSFGELAKNERKTIRVSINNVAANLKPGEHRGMINFVADGHQQQREIHLKIAPPSIVRHASFDDHENSGIGRVGQAVNPSKVGKQLKLADFLSGVESHAICFWLNWESMPTVRQVLATGRNGKARIELTFDPQRRKLHLLLEPDGFKGAVSWIDNHASMMTSMLEVDYNPARGKWHHVMFALDRRHHVAIIYIDGKVAGKTSTHSAAAYVANSLFVPENTDAVFDDAIHLNYVPEESEIEEFLSKGPEPQLTNVPDGYVAAGDVALRFQTGGADVKHYEVLAADSEESLGTIKPVVTSEGKVELSMPQPFENYFVRIDRVMNDGSRLNGTLQKLRTRKGLIQNGDFGEGLTHWRVPPGNHGPWAGNGEIHLNHPNSLLEQSCGTFIAGKLYGVLPKGVRGHRGVLKVRFVARNAGTDKLLKSVDLSITDQFGPGVYWFPKRPDNYEGCEVILQVAYSKDRVHLDALKAFVSDQSKPNEPPVVDETQLLTTYVYEVKNNLTDIALGHAINDPDGDRFTIEKISGPTWLDVRNSDRLFTPFGPPESELGQHKMRFRVTDTHKNSTELEIMIKVVHPGKIALHAHEAVLPVGKEVRLSGRLLTHFTNDEATATWRFLPNRTAKYDIVVHAGSLHDNTGYVTVGERRVEFPIKSSGGYGNVVPHKVGTFELTRDELCELTLGVVRRVDGLCDLESVELISVDE